ncbi:MAG: hypothetical protein KDE00_08905 [Rhodobacteraceae bacterium]|nr:hypothetical protein [Paracoccaceae bacterium]
MTALSEYQRLESTGLWRETAGAQRREVIVSFGEATLSISDPKSGRALAHWSLPAVDRLNGGELPALFGPGGEDGEELELTDSDMIAAIGKVHRLIEARRPHPGRLRGALSAAVLAALALAGALWLPGALTDHTAAALPEAKRQEIGLQALGELARLTGAPCAAEDGVAALDQLGGRLLGEAGEIFVVRGGIDRSVTLPGGIVVLSRRLIEESETPDIAAGEVLAAGLRGATVDPMRDLLNFAGLRASITLLTSGDLPEGALAGYGEHLVTKAPDQPPARALLERFADAGVASTPYARALDPSGQTVLPLIEADPYKGTAPPRPLLSDTDWVAIQGICGD